MDMRPPLMLSILIFSLLLDSKVHTEAAKQRRKQGAPIRGKGQGSSTSSTVDKLLNWYDRQEPPMKDHPTEVKLGIYINSFYSVSEQTMDYSVSMYLRQQWRDPRLAYNIAPPGTEVDGKGAGQVGPDFPSTIRLGDKRWEEIWVPDVFFRNEKRAAFHDVTVANRLLKLNATGHLWYVTKISAALSCPMKLQKYPLDTQTCPMMFESFGYTMDVMYFGWLDTPVDVDKDVQLPQFTLEDVILYDCSQNYTAGAFPCLEVRFVLRRDIGFFLIQVYIPSILIVILSWVSFWLNIDATPARVSMGLLTVLTMTTQSTGANASLPRVSYIKAIDLWMSTCLIFVFTALLEFAVVNVISRSGKRSANPVRRPAPTVQKLDSDLPLEQLHGNRSGMRAMMIQVNAVENGQGKKEGGKPADMEGKHKARKIDKLARKAFPLAFLLFNLIYWIIYTIPSALGDG